MENYLLTILRIICCRIQRYYYETMSTVGDESDEYRYRLNDIRALLYDIDKTVCPPDMDDESAAVYMASEIGALTLKMEQTQHPIARMAEVFGLDAFEVHCLYLALSVELDVRFSIIFGYIEESPPKYPNLNMAINLFDGGFATVTQVLQRYARQKNALQYLFQMPTAGGSYLQTELRLTERAFRYILDPDAPCTLANSTLFLSAEPLNAPLADEATAEGIRHLIESSGKQNLIILSGEKGSGKKYHIKRVAQQMHRPVLFVKGTADFSADTGWVNNIITELILRKAFICFTDCTITEETKEKLCEHLTLFGPYSRQLFVTTEDDAPVLEIAGFSRVVVKMSPISAEVRTAAWQAFTQAMAVSPGTDFTFIANTYQFSPGHIAQAAQTANDLAILQANGIIDEDILIKACKANVFHNLKKLATPVRALYRWDDLVLESPLKNKMREICGHVKNKHVVYEHWNFNAKLAYGTGLSMLFSGAPGTGKTMAAQVMANELDMDIYKIELADMVSKYIGETEKNIKYVFTEAKKSNAILFFDEADALFGKRTEVKDSHDKNANMETAYILQKMEDYDGIVILATNFLSNFDEAFKRRIKFILEFPLPNAEARQKIWESVFPAQAPLSAQVDFKWLAEKIQVTGSNIKNAAVNAAFLAAESGTEITMAYVLKAVRDECLKNGNVIIKEDFGVYAKLL